MSERPNTLSDGVLWGSRLGVAGTVIVALAVAVSVVGIDLASPVYSVD